MNTAEFDAMIEPCRVLSEWNPTDAELHQLFWTEPLPPPTVARPAAVMTAPPIQTQGWYDSPTAAPPRIMAVGRAYDHAETLDQVWTPPRPRTYLKHRLVPSGGALLCLGCGQHFTVKQATASLGDCGLR